MEFKLDLAAHRPAGKRAAQRSSLVKECHKYTSTCDLVNPPIHNVSYLCNFNLI